MNLSSLVVVSLVQIWEFVNNGPVLGLFGVVLTVLAVNHNHKRQLKSSNEQAEKLLNLRIDEIKSEIHDRTREREIAVGRVVLPKTMDAVQTAFSHLMVINDVLNSASLKASFSEALMLELTPERFHDTLRDIRTWYNNNCLYLPNSIRKGFVGLLNHCGAHIDELYAGKQPRKSNKDIWDMYLEKSNSVEGIMVRFMERYDLFDKTE
jgi:hypothetical protein